MSDPETKPEPQPVRTVRFGVNYLEPDIRAQCLELADGDVHRVEVLGPRLALVH